MHVALPFSPLAHSALSIGAQGKQCGQSWQNGPKKARLVSAKLQRLVILHWHYLEICRRKHSSQSQSAISFLKRFVKMCAWMAEDLINFVL
jgi:hypothetical protein